VANRKISEFTALTAPDASDVLAIIDQSESGADKNKKITYANLLSKIPVGNAAAPSLSFLSDQDSGISGGTDTLVLSTGGTAAISVDSSQNVTLSANLTVNGTTTTINTTNLDVEDKNITLAKVSSPSDTIADGGGITIKGTTDKTFNWVNSTDAFTSSEHIHLGDNKKLLLGSDSDLEIFHDGSDSFITNATNIGWLRLYSGIGGSRGILFKENDGGEEYARMTSGGAVDLFFNNTKRFETTSTGATVTGTLVADGFHVGDTEKYVCGNSNDLELKHAGDENYLWGNGAHSLTIGTNATVALKIDSSQNATFSGDIDLADSKKVKLGASDNLEIYFDGSNSYIVNTTGALLIRDESSVSIRTDAFSVNSFDNSESIFTGEKNTASRMYFDGVKRLETTSGGVKFFGTLEADDSDKIKLGDNADLQIYHDGSDSFIENDSNIGWLRINSGAAGSRGTIFKNNSNSEEYARMTSNGSVDLYYDNSLKLASTSSGITVTGTVTTTANITTGEGVLFPDATSGNTGQAIFGAGGDLKIYHNGTDSYIHNSTGNLVLLGDFIQVNNAANSEGMAWFEANAAVGLKYDNSLKLATTSSGITVTGTVTETSDISLKNNINTIQNPLDLIEQIRGINFTWKTNGMKSMGVIAQDVEKVFPELVHGSEGSKSLQYSGLIGALVESVKELSAKVAALETK